MLLTAGCPLKLAGSAAGAADDLHRQAQRELRVLTLLQLSEAVSAPGRWVRRWCLGLCCCMCAANSPAACTAAC